MATANLTGETDSATIGTQEGEWYSLVMTLAAGTGTLAATFTGADGSTAHNYKDKDGNNVTKTASYQCIFLALGPALLLNLTGGTAGPPATSWHVKVTRLPNFPRSRG